MKHTITCLILLFTIHVFGQETISLNEENADDIVFYRNVFIDVKAKDKIFKTVSYKVLVLNGESEFNNLVIHYDKTSSVTDLEVSLYDSSGKKIKKFKKNDVKDYPSFDYSLHTDSRYLVEEFGHYDYPFSLEVEYKIKQDGALIYDVFKPQNYNQSVIQSSFSISSPKELPIRYQLNNDAPEPEIIEVNDLVQLSWKFNDLKAVDYESMAPSSRKIFPVIKIYPKFFHYDGYEGSLESWSTFNVFYYTLNNGRDVLSPDMEAKVKSMVAGIEDEKEKIEVLYNYLKDNMRYVSVQLGIGGYQTFDAHYVEKNKYGDCKALSNFMGAMLKAVEIPYQKVLIYRSGDPRDSISNDFPELAFNHAIAYVPSQDMFIECTSNNYPLGYLGYDNADKKVIISTDAGPVIKRTPYMGKDDNIKHTYTDIFIQEDGSAKLTNTTTLRGEPHDRIRYLLEVTTEEALRKEFQEDFPVSIQKLNKLEMKMEKNEPVVNIEYDIELGKYASKAGKRLFIPINLIHANQYTPAKIDDRKLPFSNYVEKTIENEIVINLPEGYEVEAIPNENFSQESIYSDFRFSISQEDNKIKVYKKFVLKSFDQPAEKYEEFRQTMKEYADLDNGKIVLVQKKT